MTELFIDGRTLNRILSREISVDDLAAALRGTIPAGAIRELLDEYGGSSSTTEERSVEKTAEGTIEVVVSITTTEKKRITVDQLAHLIINLATARDPRKTADRPSAKLKNILNALDTEEEAKKALLAWMSQIMIDRLAEIEQNT